VCCWRRGGNGKGQIFVRGKIIATVPESKIVETLIEEAMRLVEEAGGEARTPTGKPQVII
jgi:(E)-4-hydroxy-3-methylbut-2-enyl-diphosphate synthase